MRLWCRLWDVGAGTCIHQLAFSGKVWALSFHADGQYLVVAGDDGDVSIWSVNTAKKILNVPCHGPISSVTCDSRRNVVAAASSRNKQIYLIKVLMD